jgi:hypothetical protein
MSRAFMFGVPPRTGGAPGRANLLVEAEVAAVFGQPWSPTTSDSGVERKQGG